MQRNTFLMMLVFMTLGLIAPVAGVAAPPNQWTGTGPFATGLGNRVISALAVSADGKTVYSGTASGTVFSYEVTSPTAVTNTASGIGASGSTLKGTVNAYNADTTVAFEYGLTTAYGSIIGGTPSTVTGASDTAVTANATGLIPGATYHYRVTAVSSSGTTYGNDQSFTLQKATTTTTLASSLNPSATGQSVTFTATVTGVTVPPTGTVTFMDGANNLGSATLNLIGQAVFSTSSLAMGNRSITAVYGGNASFFSSSSVLLSQTVNEASTITTANNTAFDIGAAGSFTVTATGYPTPTLSESGALPSGVTFNAATGVLSGTPAAGTEGVYPITFTAHNTSGPDAVQNFTLTVNRIPAITSAGSTTFTIGTAGSFPVTATGYPTPTLSESGTLPTGITFNTATGELGGTPAVGTNGVYHIIFTASNGTLPNATQDFNLTVAFDAGPPTLTVSTLSDGAVTTVRVLNISGTVTCINGIQSLTINGATVMFSSDGSFSFPFQLAAGANTITIVATDNAGHQTTSTRTITLATAGPSLTVTSPTDGTITAQTSVTVTGTSSADTMVEAKINGGAGQAASQIGEAFTVTVNLAAGLNTIEVTATDLSNAKSSVKLTVFSNPTGPELSITSPSNDLITADQALTLSGTASSSTAPPVKVSIAFDGQTFTPTVTGGAFQQYLTMSAEKTCAIVVTATDASSNSSVAQRNVIYSLTASGDINGDGTVDIIDALVAMKTTVNLMTPTAEQMRRGDVAPLVNGVPESDGKIDIDDAVLILRKAVGLDW